MKGIIGAICGDIIGSTREHNQNKTKDFNLFEYDSIYTDDTVMTIAIASWLIKDPTCSDKEMLIGEVQYWGNEYPDSGYGGSFIKWLKEYDPQPYESWGNGSAMRVSPVAWVSSSLEECEKIAKISAEITHNHPEGIKGAQATAAAIYLARNNMDKTVIKEYIEDKYGYDLSRKLDDIRPDYKFDVSCQGSVPESIICFLEAENYEDCIRNAISLGGDADTQAAIAGSIASAYWDVPQAIYETSIQILTYDLADILFDFDATFLNQNG